MLNKKFYALGFLPVFGLMMMSPSTLRTTHISRGIAATESSLSDIQREKQRIHDEAQKVKDAGASLIVVEPLAEVKLEKAEFVRYKAIADKYQKDKPKELSEFNKDRAAFLNNLKSISEMVESEEKNFPAKIENLDKVKELQGMVEAEVSALSDLEKDLSLLKEKNLITLLDEEKPNDKIDLSKSKLEGLLKRLEEAKVALETPEKKPEAVAAVAVAAAKPEEKKEEVKPEVKEEKEEKESRRARADRKHKEEEKSQYDLLCEIRDQNKAMTESMQKLVEDQSNIMKQMLGMMQSMVSMQQANQNLNQQNSAYQYHPQYPTGNWMFVPNGFQPSFSSFGTQAAGPYTPQLFGNQPMYNAGQPDQSAVTSGAWSLRPDQSFQLSDPRMTPMTNLSPGQFGGNSSLGNFGFDMSQNSPAPMSAQPQQFQPQQVPFSLPSTSPQLGGPMTWV